jgi:hypothetical protein
MIKISVQTALKSASFAIMLALSLLPVQAWPQVLSAPATFLPSNPSANDRVRATFSVSSVCFSGPPEISTQLVGTVVRTTVKSLSCVIGPPASVDDLTTFFGPLPANTYTYEIYLQYPDGTVEFRSSQPLVVAPSPIPALTPRWLLLLAASLPLLGIAVLKSK